LNGGVEVRSDISRHVGKRVADMARFDFGFIARELWNE
jgi:hypothetical protein